MLCLDGCLKLAHLACDHPRFGAMRISNDSERVQNDFNYLQSKTYNCGINCAGEKWLLFYYSQKAKYEEMLKDAKQKCDEETKTVSILP